MDNPTPKPKSSYLTYVTERDNIDREHMGLFRALHEVQRNARDVASGANNLKHLKTFGILLRAHHASEKAFLDIVDPKHAAVHIESHCELERMFEALLEEAGIVGLINVDQISNLIHFLSRHIQTLDIQLQKAVDEGHR